MKSQAFASLILASLTFNAFALPESQPQPLLGELRSSQAEARPSAPAQPLAQSAAKRLNNPQIAEGGAERVGRKRVLKDAGKRAGNRQIAEGGAERLLRTRKG